jgi:hypothetical protein
VRKRLGEMLIEAGVIDEAQLQAALGHQRRWGGRVGQALVHLNLAHEDDVVDALGRKFGFEVTRLDAIEPYALGQALALVPRDVALRNHLLPIAADTSTITVAMSDPTNVSVIDELRFRTGRRVVVKIAGELAISDALKVHYPGPLGRAEVEAIALDLEGDAAGEQQLDTLLDPFGGGTTDELEAFFSAQNEARAADVPIPPAPAPETAVPGGGGFALELEEGTPARGYPVGDPRPSVVPLSPSKGHHERTEAHHRTEAHERTDAPGELEEEPQELTPLEELPGDELLLDADADADAPESYFDAAPLDPAAAELPKGASVSQAWAGWAPEEPVPEPATLAELAAAPSGVEEGRLTDAEFAVLDALDRIASGGVAEEPAVVKPAQIAAALVRLLIRKGIVTDQEFLDELLTR